MENMLSGKVVIITGASSGIGAATARLLADYQCKLILAARSTSKLQQLADSLKTETLVVPADMTVPGDIISMVDKTMAAFGRVDVMFANAGIYIPGHAAFRAWLLARIEKPQEARTFLRQAEQSGQPNFFAAHAHFDNLALFDVLGADERNGAPPLAHRLRRLVGAVVTVARSLGR